MKPEDLLEAIGEIDETYAKDAHDARKRSHSRAVPGTLAAVTAAAVLAAVLLSGKPGPLPDQTPERLTTESAVSLEQVEELYGGTLLAENLVTAGAELTGIQLEHEEGVDIADVSGWKTLSFTAERGGEKLEMTCTFDAPGDLALPGEPDDTLDYGGVTVRLFFGPWDGGQIRMEDACRAVFSKDGVLYDMAFLCEDEDDRKAVYEYLDLLLGEKDGGSADALHPLESLMGFTDYRVTVEGDYLGSTWHFWLDLGGEETCVAECFGPECFEPEGAYSVDLDGDGVPEVVTNNVYGDGRTLVRVFRYADGVFSVGTIDRSWYEELGFEGLDWFGSVEERYDPERGVFAVTNLPDSEREVTFSGPEHLLFRSFTSNGVDHFDTCPLTYDEMEHTDARPVDSVFGYADYKIGIEHVEDDGFWRPYDVWHFWVDIDGTLTCVADIRDLSEKTSRLYSADPDGDGVPELIAVTFNKIAVYRRAEGRTEELEPDPEFMNELRARVPEGVLRGSYDPEQNAFVYTVEDYREPPEVLYKETQTGLDFMSACENRHQRHCSPEYFTVPAVSISDTSMDGPRVRVERLPMPVGVPNHKRGYIYISS